MACFSGGCKLGGSGIGILGGKYIYGFRWRIHIDRLNIISLFAIDYKTASRIAFSVPIKFAVLIIHYGCIGGEIVFIGIGFIGTRRHCTKESGIDNNLSGLLYHFDGDGGVFGSYGGVVGLDGCVG